MNRARRLALLPCLVLVVGLAAWRLVDTGPCDDDFIVYRYAQNLLQGHGLAFNPGERVEGFTCPAWLALMAGGLALGVAPAALSVCTGFASLWAAAALAFVARGRDLRESDLWGALAIAASATLGYHAAQGLGTVPAAALLAACYVLSARAEDRGGFSRLAPLCVGVAALLRPETLLFAPACAFAAPRGRRLAALALALALPLAWLAFRRAYFGEWLPMTYHVKKLPLAEDLGYGLRYFARSTFDCGIGLLLAFTLAVRLGGFGLRSRSASAALAGAVLTTAAVVGVGGDYMFLARFYVPLLPLLLLLAADALEDLRLRRPALLRAAWIALVLLQLWPWSRLVELRESQAFYEQRWIAIGQELARRAPPGWKLATSPIGAIGFHSRLGIVDLLGITNRVIRDAAPNLAIDLKGHHRSDATWVLEQQPDGILLGNGVMPEGRLSLTVNAWEQALFLHPRFRAEYEARLVPVTGSYELPYFQRRESPSLAGARPVPAR